MRVSAMEIMNSGQGEESRDLLARWIINIQIINNNYYDNIYYLF